MPDLPQPAPGGAPPPAADAAPPSGGDAPPSGGGITDAITQIDGLMLKLSSAVGKSQLPDDVKAAWSGALKALRDAEASLVNAAGGEADGQPEPDADDQGATTMEQGGAKGAVPMSHQNMRG